MQRSAASVVPGVERGEQLAHLLVNTYTRIMPKLAERAAIYCRLSWAPDGSVEKVERQEEDCRALADRLGWTISSAQLQADSPPGVLRDNSRSAWKRNRKRPGWDALLAAIDEGAVDSVIVYHGDRLMRQPYDLETLIQLVDQRGLPIASPSGVRDLASADDRFILRIEVAQACRSSDDTSRRVKRGWAARARKGLAIGGGRRAFGFETDGMTLRPAEAEILSEAAGRRLAGQSQAGVVEWLNSVSTTSTGGPWSAKTLRNLLASPRVAGLIEHDGELFEAKFPAIIDVSDWHELRALYASSAEANPYPGRTRKYLLSGVAVCSECKHTMRTKPTGGRNRPASRIYHCPDCKKVGRNVDHLDAYVTGRVLRRLGEPAFLEELHSATSEGRDGLAAEIAALERRRDATRDQLANLADHPNLSPDLIARSLESFERKISELRNHQATTSRQRLLSGMAGIDRETWERLPIDIRSSVVDALFHVVVMPTKQRGPGFDSSAVRIKRRTADDRSAEQ